MTLLKRAALVVFLASFVANGIHLAAQATATQTPSTPPPAPSAPPVSPSPSSTYTSDMGFVYNAPPDWNIVDSKPIMPTVRMQAADKAESDSEKRTAECLQVGLTARHGNPASVLVMIGVPFECLGSTLKESDLAGFGLGVSTGMVRTFDMKDPVYGAYKWGSHGVWIERAIGSPKAHPEQSFTIDTVCTILAKGAMCWLGMAKDDEALQAFEKSLLSVDGGPPQALVPPDAFPAKH